MQLRSKCGNSVRPSVRPSVTLMYVVETAEQFELECRLLSGQLYIVSGFGSVQNLWYFCP